MGGGGDVVDDGFGDGRLGSRRRDGLLESRGRRDDFGCRFGSFRAIVERRDDGKVVLRGRKGSRERNAGKRGKLVSSPGR
jgi:hypothetical protein